MVCAAASLPVQTGLSWIFGGGLNRTSQMPGWVTISRMTDGFSMLPVIRMAP